MAVLAKSFFSACMPQAQKTAMFKPKDLKLVIDGRVIHADPMYSLALGTIDRLSLGIRPFAPEPILPGGFHISGNAMPVARVALNAATLLYQVGDQRKLARKVGKRLVTATGAQELRCELSEGFTMDGEMFPIEGTKRVRISAGPVVSFWTARNR
jgi:hypothetical protein